MNQHSLDVIETAQFVVCLDKVHPHISHLKSPDSSGMQDYHKTILANNVLHGNGSQHNSCNRWFDHAIQVSGHSRHCVHLVYAVSCLIPFIMA